MKPTTLVNLDGNQLSLAQKMALGKQLCDLLAAQLLASGIIREDTNPTTPQP